MKKYISLLFAAVVIVGVSGCSKTGDGTPVASKPEHKPKRPIAKCEPGKVENKVTGKCETPDIPMIPIKPGKPVDPIKPIEPIQPPKPEHCSELNTAKVYPAYRLADKSWFEIEVINPNACNKVTAKTTTTDWLNNANKSETYLMNADFDFSSGYPERTGGRYFARAGFKNTRKYDSVLVQDLEYEVFGNAVLTAEDTGLGAQNCNYSLSVVGVEVHSENGKIFKVQYTHNKRTPPAVQVQYKCRDEYGSIVKTRYLQVTINQDGTLPEYDNDGNTRGVDIIREGGFHTFKDKWTKANLFAKMERQP